MRYFLAKFSATGQLPSLECISNHLISASEIGSHNMKAKDFDKKFELGEDLTDNLDFSKARRVNQEPKRVNIDFPT